MSESNSIFELFPWITSSFVKSLIVNSEQTKNVKIESFHAKKAFDKGEGFSSNIISLDVVFNNDLEGDKREENIHRIFLMKIAIDSDLYTKIADEINTFDKEIEVYSKILPAFETIFKAVGMPSQIAPRCFLTDTKQKVLVFEDLRELQFQSVDRMNGLDVEHAKLTLSTLAKWHAGTATLLLTNVELFEWHKKKISYLKMPIDRSFFMKIANSIGNAAKHWSGYENIAQKLLSIPQHAHEKVHKLFIPNETNFNVINHGDMFINNILFRYDANNCPVDIRFVDFALGKYTTPSIDLFCLLYGSTNSSIRQGDRERLIQYYHMELIKYLKLLSFPGRMPTLLEIQTVAFRPDLYNTLIVLFITGLRYVNKSFDEGAHEVAGDGHERNELFSHPDCIERVKYLLDMFDRRGYLDF